MFDDKAQDRFWIKVDRRGPDDCWQWIASKNPKGYGYFSMPAIKRSPFLAHRVSFIIANGQINDGMMIDHMCRNRGCVNPKHLRQVTPEVNTLENSVSITAINLTKTHCPKGHEYTPENTKINAGKKKYGRPFRLCRTCANIESARQRAKRKLALQDNAVSN